MGKEESHGPFGQGGRFVRSLPFLGHLFATLWLFSGVLFAGRIPYLRDLSVYYYPNYVFLGRALQQGVWPLWNPTSDAGGPFLIAYPVDLLLVAIAGPGGALAVGPPLHVLLGISGASALGRRLGLGAWGAWVAGIVYGLSGFVLSCVNLLPLLQAAAWAPWILAALLGLMAAPSASAVARLGALAALQISSLGVEIVLQTGLAALFLIPRAPTRRDLGRLSVAAGLSLLLAAPALWGAKAMMEGTQRWRGFDLQQTFGYSATPVVLLEAVIPRLFGDVHTFSDVGYWGQPFFPEGYPYLLSLYLGPSAMVLALQARNRRLWFLALLGALLCLGPRGPLALLPPAVLALLRVPVKFFFLTTVAVSVLAGIGLDRARRDGRRAKALAAAPGCILLVAGIALLRYPELPARVLGGLVPELLTARAKFVTMNAWPHDFIASGAVSLAVALALWAGRGLAPLAGILAALDLAAVNGTLNPATERTFYDLRPAVRSLVAGAAAEGPYRWFSYGVANSIGLHWAPSVLARNSDVWLYYLDRQALLPRTQVLDGLDGAFDVNRTGWAPEGSTLPIREMNPSFYRAHHARLRLANVRWVLSFNPLPEDLVSLRERVPFPEIGEPLCLYEVKDPLPRVFWVPRHEVAADASGLLARSDSAFDPRKTVLVGARVPEARFDGVEEGAAPGAALVEERTDPHTIRVRTSGPAGFIVVLEGYHRDWSVESEGRDVPLLEANGRYWTWPTPGGERVFTARYRPGWLGPSLACTALGALLGFALAIRGGAPDRDAGRSPTNA